MKYIELMITVFCPSGSVLLELQFGSNFIPRVGDKLWHEGWFERSFHGTVSGPLYCRGDCCRNKKYDLIEVKSLWYDPVGGVDGVHIKALALDE